MTESIVIAKYLCGLNPDCDIYPGKRFVLRLNSSFKRAALFDKPSGQKP